MGNDNEAQKFMLKIIDVAVLMTMLDKAGIYSEQDYENEITTWTFLDGSQIKIRNTYIEIIIQ